MTTNVEQESSNGDDSNLAVSAVSTPKKQSGASGSGGTIKQPKPIIQHSQPHTGPVTKSGKKLKDSLPAKSSSRGQQQSSSSKKNKGSKKHKKGEAPPPPRKKAYIPPPKPPKGNLDPVDLFGLGVTGGSGSSYERVPAEKVVLLRLLNKKDESSIERALEELWDWIQDRNPDEKESESEDGEAMRMNQIAETVPVWVSVLFRDSPCIVYIRCIASSID